MNAFHSPRSMSSLPGSASRLPWRHALPAPRALWRGEPPRFRSAFEILRAQPLFAAVCDGELIKFAALGHERRVERDHAVIPASGRLDPPLSLILEGDAVLACGRGPEELFLRALEPGDLVGEIDLFVSLPRLHFPRTRDSMGVREDPVPYNDGTAAFAEKDLPGRFGDATARALTTVRLIEWDRDAVREALRRWPDVALSLLGGMARRQRDMQRRVVGLCGQRAPRRLARTLTALLEERGVAHREDSGRRGLLLPRTPSRARLSEIAGMARETVSRLLADWERHGWVGSRHGDLLVWDARQLSRLAGGQT